MLSSLSNVYICCFITNVSIFFVLNMTVCVTIYLLVWCRSTVHVSPAAQRSGRPICISVTNSIKKWSSGFWDIAMFSIFQDDGCLSNVVKFYWLVVLEGLRGIAMPNWIKTGKFIAKILRFFNFFAILELFGAIWITYEEYFVVFIFLLNLAAIDIVVSIIWKLFHYLVHLAWKRLFTPKIWGFGRFDPLNGVQYQRKPKGTSLRESASF